MSVLFYANTAAGKGREEGGVRISAPFLGLGLFWVTCYGRGKAHKGFKS